MVGDGYIGRWYVREHCKYWISMYHLCDQAGL